MHATQTSSKFYTWLVKGLGYSPHDERLKPHVKSFDCLSASNEDFQEELMHRTVSPSEYAHIRKVLRLLELQKQKAIAIQSPNQILVAEQPSKILSLIQSSLVDTNEYVKSEENTRSQLTRIVHLTRINEVLDSVVKSLKTFQGATGAALVDSTRVSDTASYEKALLSAQDQAVRQFTMTTKSQISDLLSQLRNEIELTIYKFKTFLRDDEEVFENSDGACPNTHPRLGNVYKEILCNIKEGETLSMEISRLYVRESDLLATYCNEPLDLSSDDVISQVINYSMNKAPQLAAVLLKAEVFGLQRCISFLQDYSQEIECRGGRIQHLVSELSLAMHRTNAMKQKAEDQLQQIECLTDSVQRMNRKIETTATGRSRDDHKKLLNEKLDNIWETFSKIHSSLDTYSSLSIITSFRDMYMHTLAIRELKHDISSSTILMRLKEIIASGATILLSQDSVSPKIVTEERKHRQVISNVVHSDDILPKLHTHQLRDSIACIQSVHELGKIIKHTERRFSASIFTRTCSLRNQEIQCQVFDALHALLTRIDSYRETLKSAFSKRVIDNHMTEAYMAPSGVTKLGGTSNPHLKLDKSTGIVQGLKIAQLDEWLVDTRTLLEQRKQLESKIFSSLISNKLSMFYKSVAPYLLQGESLNSAINISANNLIQTAESQLASLRSDLALHIDTLKKLEYVVSTMKGFYSIAL